MIPQRPNLSPAARASDNRGSVSLHIEQLVLDGLPVTGSQGPSVRAAIETELSRLIAEQGLNHLTGGAMPHLPAESIQVTHESKPAAIGREVARVIHRSLTPALSSPLETQNRGGASS